MANGERVEAGLIRVLLVDGDSEARSVLVNALAATPEIEVVGEVGDGFLAGSAALALNPDVALLAVRLPLLSGPEAAALLADSCPSVRVVGLSDDGDADDVEAMDAVGAVGTVSREATIDDITAAVLNAVTCA
jgi:DNA-binding NarL/FixJ family response regulator